MIPFRLMVTVVIGPVAGAAPKWQACAVALAAVIPSALTLAAAVPNGRGDRGHRRGPAHAGQRRRPGPARPQEPRQGHQFVVDHLEVLIYSRSSTRDAVTNVPWAVHLAAGRSGERPEESDPTWSQACLAPRRPARGRGVTSWCPRNAQNCRLHRATGRRAPVHTGAACARSRRSPGICLRRSCKSCGQPIASKHRRAQGNP